MGMAYPKRTSRVKRKRSIGFRARMKTTNGRKLMNRKRRAGRSLNVADKKRGY
jgi:large subunit ribosomal protein L34